MINKFTREEDEIIDEEDPQVIAHQIRRNESPQKNSKKESAYQIEKVSQDGISLKNEENLNYEYPNQYIQKMNAAGQNIQNQNQLQASLQNKLNININNGKQKQSKQPAMSQNQIGVTIEDITGQHENNPITINKLEGVDFTDPKNRQILEDQFFGPKDPNRQSDEMEKQEEQIQAIIPKKFQYLALFLGFSGAILIIVGFIVAFSGSSTKIMKGGAFWVIGAICCIPGIYYTYKIFRQKIAANSDERLKVAADIPRF